jgi:outer membrane lipoprotein-sorting protein
MGKIMVAATIAALLLGSTASAQTAAPAAPMAPAAAAPATDKMAKSKECSAEADKQGLHGKARKSFRSKCRAGKA